MKRMLLLILALCAPAWVVAQDAFPSKSIVIVVPTGPGGQTDIFGRLIADHLRQRLNQPVVVENRPGAGGSVAGRYVAARPADGYTLMYGSMSTVIIAPQLQKPIAYDSPKAFVPIALTQSGSSPFTVRANSPFRSAADLVDYARKNPGKVSYGSQGVGSVGHLAMELLASKAGITMTHVPYNGTGAALTALLGGQVDVVIADIGTSKPHVDAGTLRYVSQLATTRSRALPDVPTVAEELKISELAVDFWLGLFAPHGTPDAVVARLHKEVTEIMQVPAVKERLDASTMTASPISSAQFADQIAQQWNVWGKIVRDSNITTY